MTSRLLSLVSTAHCTAHNAVIVRDQSLCYFYTSMGNTQAVCTC